MKLIVSILVLVTVSIGSLDIDKNDNLNDNSTDLNSVVISCSDAELGSEMLMMNPCSMLSNCCGGNATFCGSISVNDPDGPNYTVVCEGRCEDDEGPDPEEN